MSTVVMKRGDDRVLDVTCVDRDGEPVDITDVFLWFTAKRSKADADTAAVLRKDSIDGIAIVVAAEGTATVTLDSADTEDLLVATVLYWDVQGKDGDGKIITLAEGILVIEADVTRTTVP